MHKFFIEEQLIIVENMCVLYCSSWDSIVSIVKSLQVGQSVVQILPEIFSSPKCPD
jgi:hypothetical protein